MAHIPYGYIIKNGRAVIDPEAAEHVRDLFCFYLQGMSIKAAAEAAVLPVCAKSAGHILKRPVYLGDDYYPCLIDPETFAQAAQERERRLARSRHRTSARPKAAVPVQKHFRIAVPPTEHHESVPGSGVAVAQDRTEISDTAQTFDMAQTSDTAQVHDPSQTTGTSQVHDFSQASGTAQVHDFSQASGTSQVHDFSQASGTAQMPDLSQTTGTAQMPDLSQATGTAQAYSAPQTSDQTPMSDWASRAAWLYSLIQPDPNGTAAITASDRAKLRDACRARFAEASTTESSSSAENRPPQKGVPPCQ